MTKHALVIYSLTITNRKSKRAVNAAEIEEESTSKKLAEVLTEELTKICDKPKRYDDRKMIMKKVEGKPDLSSEGRRVSGLIDYGFYGDISTIKDEKEKTVFRKDGTHTEYIPMYFSAYINSAKDDAFIVFQTTGRAGIKTVFSKFLENSVFSRFPDLVFRISPYWPKALLDEYRKGKVGYVTLRARKTLSDASDYKFGNQTQQEYEVETKIKPVRKRKKKDESASEKTIDIPTGENLKISDFTSDESVYDVLVGVEHNGHIRGIHIGGVGGHPPAHDINLKAVVDFDDEGQPLHAAMTRESDKLVTVWNL